MYVSIQLTKSAVGEIRKLLFICYWLKFVFEANVFARNSNTNYEYDERNTFENLTHQIPSLDLGFNQGELIKYLYWSVRIIAQLTSSGAQFPTESVVFIYFYEFKTEEWLRGKMTKIMVIRILNLWRVVIVWVLKGT